MFEKSVAVALRVTPFSNTSQVVTWLSREHGLLRTVFKGAQRPRSGLVGQYDVAQTSEVVFYTRERDGLHIGRACALLKPRAALRGLWRSWAAAAYAADLVSRTAVADGHQAAVFDALERTLDGLAAHGRAAVWLHAFELHLSDALGFGPRLDDVGAPDVTAMLRRWREAASGDLVQATRCSRKQLLALDDALAKVLGHYLDPLPDSRRVALSIVRFAEDMLP